MLVAAGVVGALVLTVGLVLFEPWRLFTSSEVDEPAPASQADRPRGLRDAVAVSGVVSRADSRRRRTGCSARGSFEDAEHDTSGARPSSSWPTGGGSCGWRGSPPPTGPTSTSG